MNKLYIYSCENWGEEVFQAKSRKEAKEYIKPKLDADSCKYIDKQLKELTEAKIENIKRNYHALYE